MNKEVIKAMNRKNDRKPNILEKASKWWDRNGYKVNRVILFPIWIGTIVYDKYQAKMNAKEQWNEDKAKAILDYYIPRRSHWDGEKKSFYFFDNGYGWDAKETIKKYINRKDRRFWGLHRGWSGGRIRNYLIDSYELEGFTKEVISAYDGGTEIEFKMIEK